MSPFCSVQTFNARSPLPRGIESFSFVPNPAHAGSLLATKEFPLAGKPAASKAKANIRIFIFILIFSAVQTA